MDLGKDLGFGSWFVYRNNTNTNGCFVSEFAEWESIAKGTNTMTFEKSRVLYVWYTGVPESHFSIW